MKTLPKDSQVSKNRQKKHVQRDQIFRAKKNFEILRRQRKRI